MIEYALHIYCIIISLYYYSKIRFAGDVNIPLRSGTKDVVGSFNGIAHEMVKLKVAPKKSQEIDIKHIGEIIQRESGDLWGVFWLIDSMIDNVESSLSGHLGSNKGHRALQIILLMIPVLVIVVVFAAYLLLGSVTQQMRGPDGAAKFNMLDNGVKQV